MKKALLNILLLVSLSIQAQVLDLSGSWNTELGVCKLPGTTDENHLGEGKHPTNVTTQLTRLFPYTGALVYERSIDLPASLAKMKHLTLVMERAKPSTLWVDGDSVGSICQLYAPHKYRLPRLKAGKHILRIRIDNRDEVVPASVRGSHAWTDATQTNWNGILGKFYIEGKNEIDIQQLNVYPIVASARIRIRLDVQSDCSQKATLLLTCGNQKWKYKVNLAAGMNTLEYLEDMPEDILLWSELHPVLLTLESTLIGKKGRVSRQVRFGMREFGTDGTQFTINGKKTFLRGTHDGCVFPQTGYCPTDVDTWRRVFRIAKNYGINHFRFHSYTPTEAAFEAADEEGIYLQCELPIWGTIDETTYDQNKFLLNEAHTLLEQLGNHPSFMALGLGNELWGDTNLMHQWLDDFRKLDPRHLYIYGSNNTLGWNGAQDGEDYMVTCRVGGGENYKTNARTSFSFADEDDGGILNHDRPNTRRDFSYPVSITPRPIVSHETCQFQMYPDYRQIDEYKGVLYPYNLEVFRDRLKENGLEKQASDFTWATTLWGLDCYKADIEYCLRTRGFGGYQLLDLKDYPGQGSALCGILDANMHQKNSYDKHVRNVIQPVVPLALMDSHCYSTQDTLRFDIKLANYLENDWQGEVSWELASTRDVDVFDGHVNPRYPTRSGKTNQLVAKQGDLTQILHVNLPLSYLTESDNLVLSIWAKSGNVVYRNRYNLWVYDEVSAVKDVRQQCANLLVTDTLDAKTVIALNEGHTVLFTPRLGSIVGQSVGGLFTPDYWNYAMFRTISQNNNKPVSPGTLGYLIDRGSHMDTFNKYFPNSCRTEWQWWCIAKQSRPLILDGLSKSYRPIIQTVDNVERNHKLGILMGFRVGRGKLLVSTTNLMGISQWVEGRQYIRALKLYAMSEEFQPETEISIDNLKSLLYSTTQERNIQGVKNLTDYKKK